MSGMLAALDAYIARLNSGANEGYFGPVNTSQIDITDPDPDVINRTSYRPSTYGQALDSYSRPKPTEITIKFDDTDPDLLSMGLRGLPADYSQASRTAASGSFTARHDKWVALGHNSLTAFAITGKTEGTDYEVNLTGGLVKVLSTGTIADASTVSYTDSCPARTAKKIVAGTVAALQLGIKGAGLNLFNNRTIELEIFQANVSPSGAISWIGTDPMSITLKGTLIVPSGKTGPYEYIDYLT